LEIEIYMPWTARPTDRRGRAELTQEWFSAGNVDLVTALANPRPNRGKYRLRQDSEGLAHERDGGGYDLHRGSLAPRVYNADGRQAWSR
jgi:hypothetical protein